MMDAPRDVAAILAACRLVGEALGVPIVAHPALDEPGQRADPLAAIANASRIRTRRVLLRGEWWRDDAGPLLGYRQDGLAPVALLPRGPSRYALVEPATGAEMPVDAETAATLSPFADQLYRPLPEGPVSGRDVLRFALRGQAGDLRLVAFAGLVAGLLALLAPLATAYVVESLLPAGERGMVLLVGLGLAVGTLAAGVCEAARNIALLRVEGRLDAALQAAVVDRLVSLPVAFFRDYTAGDLGERAMGVGELRRRLGETAVNAALAALFSLFSLGLLFAIDWGLALLALGLIGVFALISWPILRLMLRRQRALSALEGQIAGLVLQLLLGIARLRVAGAEGRAFARWEAAFQRRKELARQLGTASSGAAVWNAAFPVLMTAAVVAAVTFGGSPRLTTAEFLAFAAALGQLVAALVALGAAAGEATTVTPLYERARPILTATPEVDAAQAYPGELTGAIALEGVSFAYREGGPLILDNVTLRIEPGEYVALVGPSGSGKSTLLRLLLGFERPTAGTVSYDGRDLASLDLRAVRRQLGVVLQSSSLMTDDLFHNIVGAAPLPVEAAWEAARLVGLDEEIRRLPMGMYTVVSEGGRTFSGGQRQRILLARALVRRPRILLLDEATSALDNLAQAKVAESLARLAVTRVVIAHRLSTIREADRIVVLEGGRIVQSGSYAELIACDGPFARLARRQLV